MSGTDDVGNGQSNTNFDITLIGISAVLLLTVFPIVQVMAPRSAPAFIAVAFVFALLPAYHLRKHGFRDFTSFNQTIRSNPLWMCLFLVVAWVLFSSLWSPTPWLGVRYSLTILGFALCVYVFNQTHSLFGSGRYFWILAIGSGLAGIFLIFELTGLTQLHWVQKKLALHDLNRNVILLGALIWPLLLMSTNGTWAKRVAIVVVAIVILDVFLSRSESGQLAMVATILVGLVCWFRPAFLFPIHLGLAAIILATPVAVKLSEPYIETVRAKTGIKFAPRLQIWNGYLNIWADSKLIGYGVGADKSDEYSQKVTFDTLRAYKPIEKTAAHAHSSVVQFWFNFGAIGAFLIALLIVVAGWKIRKLPHPSAVVATQVITFVFFSTIVGASFFQGWSLAGIAISISVLCVATKLSDMPSRKQS